WSIELADTIASAGGCSMTLDDQGSPLIAYHDAEGGLFRARRLASGWVREPVAPSRVVMGSTAMAPVPGGGAIADVDAATGSLEYAEMDAGGVWHSEMVAPVEGPEAYPSLVVDGALRAISYYQGPTGGLRLALRQTAGAWSNESVDAAGDVGGYSSLVGSFS